MSFEFFPPKTDAMEARFWDSLHRLAPLGPRVVSVTYGAGGTTRERTLRMVSRITAETGINAAAHLTCVGASRAEVNLVIQGFADVGVNRIVALRGGPPEGIGQPFSPHPQGCANAADLVAGIGRLGNLEISVADAGHPGLEAGKWWRSGAVHRSFTKLPPSSASKGVVRGQIG